MLISPRGAGVDNVDKVILVNFWHFLMLLMGLIKWFKIYLYKQTGRRVQIDGSKKKGSNRWVQIDRSK